MANIPNRDDPFSPGVRPASDEFRRDPALERELPELAEGPAGSGRMVLYAIAALAIIGAVFYGMSSSNAPTTAQSPPATQSNTAQSNNPAIRDVTPRGPNAAPGMTTGAAPTQPAAPITEAPTGANPAPAK